MALMTPRAVFFHIPKTGGTWIHRALSEAGVPFSELRCAHCTRPVGVLRERICCIHNTVKTALPIPGDVPRLLCAFVRNPLSYYQSYWSFRMRTGWDPVLPIDRAAARADFTEFVWAVLEERPRWVTGLYERFTGTASDPFLDYVGKQESLVDDLIAALSMAGESFDEEKIRRVAPMNVSGGLSEWRSRSQYTIETYNAVVESEIDAIRRFGYREEGYDSTLPA